MNANQSHTNHIVDNLFNVCSNHTMFKLLKTRIQNMKFAVIISDTPVTLKQSQGHQTYNENVDPEQAYNHAKFERSRCNSVPEKGNHQVFWEQRNM